MEFARWQGNQYFYDSTYTDYENWMNLAEFPVRNVKEKGQIAVENGKGRVERRVIEERVCRDVHPDDVSTLSTSLDGCTESSWMYSNKECALGSRTTDRIRTARSRVSCWNESTRKSSHVMDSRRSTCSSILRSFTTVCLYLNFFELISKRIFVKPLLNMVI